MEIRMTEHKDLFLTAYSDTFKTVETIDLVFSDDERWFTSTIVASFLNNMNTSNNVSKIFCGFSNRFRFDLKNVDCECTVGFINMNDQMISELLDANRYNYDLIIKTIKEFYKLGERYKLFKSMKPIKNFKIEDGLTTRSIMSNGERMATSASRTVSNIQFSNFYKTDLHKTPGSRKKLKGKNLTVHYDMMLINSKLHPLAIIEFPISPNVSIRTIVDIHPDNDEDSEQKIKTRYVELDILLQNRINKVLKKELGLESKVISKLSIDEKLDYLTIAEMSEI
jgi:hypothetical protein